MPDLYHVFVNFDDGRGFNPEFSDEKRSVAVDEMNDIRRSSQLKVKNVKLVKLPENINAGQLSRGQREQLGLHF